MRYIFDVVSIKASVTRMSEATSEISLSAAMAVNSACSESVPSRPRTSLSGAKMPEAAGPSQRQIYGVAVAAIVGSVIE